MPKLLAILYTPVMRPETSTQTRIRQIARQLDHSLGPQNWWPAESPFEVVVGAYLTQNTAWGNVELALANLRSADRLSVEGIRRTPLPELEILICPAGFFRQKAARLLHFVAHLDQHYGGSLERLFARPTAALREELLALPGVGPETADSILLYAAGHEVFVVDAYTRRIFERHGLFPLSAAYDELRLAVEAALPRPQDESPYPPAYLELPIHPPSAASRLELSPVAREFNELHAHLVQIAKHFCRKRVALCEGCPLAPLLPPR